MRIRYGVDERKRMRRDTDYYGRGWDTMGHRWDVRDAVHALVDEGIHPNVELLQTNKNVSTSRGVVVSAHVPQSLRRRQIEADDDHLVGQEQLVVPQVEEVEECSVSAG